MRILICAAAIALLAGCASAPSGPGKPTVTATTAKKPGPYAMCVLHGWQESRTSPVMSRTAGGYRLVIGTPDQSDDILVITEKGSGSSVQLYHRKSWVPGAWRSATDVAVKECL